jgi:Mn-dependent DtxR family transcriptional regulator
VARLAHLGCLKTNGEKIMAVSTKTASEKILNVLDRSSKALTTSQIASRTRVNEKTVRNLLPQLARDGEIVYGSDVR